MFMINYGKLIYLLRIKRDTRPRNVISKFIIIKIVIYVVHLISFWYCYYLIESVKELIPKQLAVFSNYNLPKILELLIFFIKEATGFDREDLEEILNLILFVILIKAKSHYYII